MKTPKQQLEDFLQEHPELKEYQRRLELAMDSVYDHERMQVLVRHLNSNLDELSTELKLLQLKIEELKGLYPNKLN